MTVLDEASLAALPDVQPQPEEHALRRVEETELWKAVAHLSAKYRTVLTLFYQGQLSYEDIARALSLPLGTVKAQLNRARHALARLLRKESRDG